MPRPFDIRERSFLFACEIVASFPARRPLDPPSWRVWSQLVASGTSVGAHLEEADAASSRAHFVALNRGALRELREARYWMRLIAAAQLQGHDKIELLESEASELIAIVTTIVKNTLARSEPRDPKR